MTKLIVSAVKSSSVAEIKAVSGLISMGLCLITVAAYVASCAVIG